MTSGNVLLPAAARGQKTQPETLAATFLRDVATQRVANKFGNRRTATAGQRVKLLIDGFIHKDCRTFHMMYSNIQLYTNGGAAGSAPSSFRI